MITVPQSWAIFKKEIRKEIPGFPYRCSMTDKQQKIKTATIKIQTGEAYESEMARLDECIAIAKKEARKNELRAELEKVIVAKIMYGNKKAETQAIKEQIETTAAWEHFCRQVKGATITSERNTNNDFVVRISW